MTRQYSAKTFLRNTPNEILKQYFDQRRIDLKLEWVRLHETEVNPIFLALEELPEAIRSEMDSDFRIINELACNDGIQTILEDAPVDRDWAGQFARMKNNYERAFWTFLHEPQRFRAAGSFHNMDRRGGWRRRFVGYRLEARGDDEALGALENQLRLFYRRQGRGRFCHVDHYQRCNPDRHCYFAYPEDYAGTDMGYDDNGRIQHRPRRSAFEIIFVYRPEDGILEVCAKGGQKQIAELEEMFCVSVLGLQELPDAKGRVPYDLAVLKDGRFPFTTDPRDRVAAVHVRQIRFDLPGPMNRRIVLSADTCQHTPRALHDFLDEAVNKSSVSLGSLHVSLAKLRLTFAPLNGERPKTLTFEVTYPDRCTLKDDPHDQIAKKYLKAWGIARD